MCTQALYDKQGRSANFKTEAEHSKWVNKEIKAAEARLKQQQTLAGSCRDQIATLGAAVKVASQVRTQACNHDT